MRNAALTPKICCLRNLKECSPPMFLDSLLLSTPRAAQPYPPPQMSPSSSCTVCQHSLTDTSSSPTNSPVGSDQGVFVLFSMVANSSQADATGMYHKEVLMRMAFPPLGITLWNIFPFKCIVYGITTTQCGDKWPPVSMALNRISQSLPRSNW